MTDETSKKNNETTSLAEAAAGVRENGAIGRSAKGYKRALNSSMASALVLIRKAFRQEAEWLDLPDYFSRVRVNGATIRGGDWAKLVHWSLIEPKPVRFHPCAFRRVRLYKITARGIDFTDRRIRVPKYAFIYDQRCLGLSEETVSIDEALGDVAP